MAGQAACGQGRVRPKHLEHERLWPERRDRGGLVDMVGGVVMHLAQNDDIGVDARKIRKVDFVRPRGRPEKKARQKRASPQRE